MGHSTWEEGLGTFSCVVQLRRGAIMSQSSAGLTSRQLGGSCNFTARDSVAHCPRPN